MAVVSVLGPAGVSMAARPAMVGKSPAYLPAVPILVDEFDLWAEGYYKAVVYIFIANTTTLAPVFTDVQMTVAADNPQTLDGKKDSIGRSFGKFTKSLYTPYAYELDIATIQQTGVHRVPITTLAGEDASNAFSLATGGTKLRRLRDRFADGISVLDYGDFKTDGSPDSNLATLTAAIGAASAMGGGVVNIPAGTFAVEAFTIPAGVIVSGAGRRVTILTCSTNAEACTITGDRAGIGRLTLDGIDLTDNGVGIFGKNVDEVAFVDLEVQRFDTGIRFLGGLDHVYRNLYVLNCTIGPRFLGDTDTVNGGGGTEFSGLDWRGGSVEQTTDTALEFSIIDQPVRHNIIGDINILDNVGTFGILIHGARFITLERLYWEGNTNNLKVEDEGDPAVEDRTVTTLLLHGGQMVGGTVIMDGECEDVIFDGLELDTIEAQMNVPTYPITVKDCFSFNVTISGSAPEKWTTYRQINRGAVATLTSAAAASVVWKTKMGPGELALIHADVLARQVNGPDYAVFSVLQAVRGTPAALAFDGQSVNFTVGNDVQGQTSLATATIVSQVDGGDAGTLSVIDVEGAFIDNEILTETNGTGRAIVNGPMTANTAVLVGTMSTITFTRSASASTWTCSFDALQQEGRFIVTGEAAKTIEWTTNMRLTAPNNA